MSNRVPKYWLYVREGNIYFKDGSGDKPDIVISELSVILPYKDFQNLLKVNLEEINDKLNALLGEILFEYLGDREFDEDRGSFLERIADINGTDRLKWSANKGCADNSYRDIQNLLERIRLLEKNEDIDEETTDV